MELEETSENVYTAFVEDEEFILNYMDSPPPSMSIAEYDRDSESALGKLDGMGETFPMVKPMRSPMPGTIQEVFVSAGDIFEEGDQICLLESMKMQQIIRAESHGTVKEVKVSQGEAILDGAVILNYV